MIKGVLLGTLAGVVGAAVWAAIAYYANFEIGWIAWGIGVGVGFAVAAGVGGEVGVPSGVLALVLTCLSIVGGKYAAIEISIDNEIDTLIEQESAKFANDEYTISYIADTVVGEWEEAGKTVAWPANVDPEMAEKRTDYPSDVWAEAENRWDAMTPAEREAFRDTMRQMQRANMEQFMEEVRDEAAAEGFKASFSLFDLIFFGLGAVTAFKIGSGAGREAA